MHETPRHGEDPTPGDDRLARVLGQVAANEAVRSAEQAVCDAWLADLADADRSAADAMTRCQAVTDAACETLGSALLARDVHGIATAQTALEDAIRELEESIACYEVVHALWADQCVWSAEAAALRLDEAASDEDRLAEAFGA
jgi:hypothetical protein